MTRSILLTGGSGLLGRHLTTALLAKGYTVSHLSRKAGNDARIKTYVWDINKGIIDERCIDGVDTIVHLAGSGIAEKRWTEARKKDLIDSRVKSIELVYDLMKRKQHQVTSVVSASGIGYYSNRGDELMFETNAPTHDFISQCCVLWEDAVNEVEKLGIRTVKFRTGVVLDKNGGALPTLAKPIKLLVGSPIGSGKQWVSWIHWLDVVDMYLLGIENKDLNGVYNMVAPNPVTNLQLTQAVAKHLHKPLWAPNVPGFLLKLLLGEMSSIVLGSTKVSAQKIEDAGFKFKYTDLDAALTDIYGS
ncbi:TIGR01777 family oxidoreductase [Mucilaginibacter kameinonensis]|uniref:TIGR01777 family oxidoreductase n=1 Tax=Mucilaginibacter kameinonensis TaxID=452286 RepID=UPI000EF7F54E|nr:TIGR01777 family oxidoreductase [Mucilaginibacter kameinonensis]